MNEIEEAKEFILNITENNNEEYCETILDSLDKQTPKKPNHLTAEKDIKFSSFVFKKGTKIHKCECKKLVGYMDSFCRHCGQKLEW